MVQPSPQSLAGRRKEGPLGAGVCARAHAFCGSSAAASIGLPEPLQGVLLDVRTGYESLILPGVYYPGGILGGTPPDGGLSFP